MLKIGNKNSSVLILILQRDGNCSTYLRSFEEDQWCTIIFSLIVLLSDVHAWLLLNLQLIDEVGGSLSLISFQFLDSR